MPWTVILIVATSFENSRGIANRREIDKILVVKDPSGAFVFGRVLVLADAGAMPLVLVVLLPQCPECRPLIPD